MAPDLRLRSPAAIHSSHGCPYLRTYVRSFLGLPGGAVCFPQAPKADLAKGGEGRVGVIEPSSTNYTAIAYREMQGTVDIELQL